MNMPARLLIVLIAGAVALALPATASAKLTIGIAENTPSVFSDPLFKQLGAKKTRVVTSYDVMTSGDNELERVTEYLTSAHANGIEPLVTFEHARGDATICNVPANKVLRQCVLPTAAVYEQNLRLFLARFPFVKVIAPWNEANHFTQPTAKNPKAAATFTKIARQGLPGLQDRRGRHPRPGRQHQGQEAEVQVDHALDQEVPQGLQGLAQDLRPAQLLGHQPLPRHRHQGHHQGAGLQADLADRDRRHLPVRQLHAV